MKSGKIPLPALTLFGGRIKLERHKWAYGRGIVDKLKQPLALAAEVMKKPTLYAEVSSPSPPAPSLCGMKSVTRDEIDRYWRMRRMIEEDHLLAAEKAAARISAKALKGEDYRRFEDSLEDRKIEADEGDDDDSELWIGIQNWWTRSKFAYLNQPAIKSVGDAATPQCPNSTGTFSCYLSPSVVQFCCTTSFGVLF